MIRYSLIVFGALARLETCTTSVKRIKDGPANFERIIENGKKYTDLSFRRRN